MLKFFDPYAGNLLVMQVHPKAIHSKILQTDGHLSFWCSLYETISMPFSQTAHNWQKWKSTFHTYHCHEIYREEAVGLKENAYKKSKNPSPFFRKTIGSNKSFTLIENNFKFLR